MVGINPLQSVYKRKTKIISRVPSTTANAPGKAAVGGNLREAIFGATIALPLVMTVTVKAAGAPVLRITEAGALARCAQGCAGAGEGDGSVVVEARCELQRVVGGLTCGDGDRERGRRATDRKRRRRGGKNV